MFLTLETSLRSDTHDLQALRRGCPVGALAASSSGGSIAADHAAACSVLLFVRQGPSPHRIFPSCGSGSSCAPHGPLYRPVTACHARSRRMAWLATARAVPVRGLAMSPESALLSTAQDLLLPAWPVRSDEPATPLRTFRVSSCVGGSGEQRLSLRLAYCANIACPSSRRSPHRSRID